MAHTVNDSRVMNQKPLISFLRRFQAKHLSRIHMMQCRLGQFTGMQIAHLQKLRPEPEDRFYRNAKQLTVFHDLPSHLICTAVQQPGARYGFPGLNANPDVVSFPFSPGK